jgi:hypothetical protein
MTAEPATVAPPEHPLHQLTTGELSRYKAELEHEISGISPDAPAAAGLRRLLADVLAEEDDRARIRQAVS